VSLLPTIAPVYPLTQTVAAQRPDDAGVLAAALAHCRSADPEFVFAPDFSPEVFRIEARTPNELARRIDEVRATAAIPIRVAPIEVRFCWTPQRVAEAEHRLGNSDGSTGAFAVVRLRVVPRQSGEGNQFESEFAGPPQIDTFNQAVAKGVARFCAEGLDKAGPIIDMRVVFIDGAFHSTRSTAAGFEKAAFLALEAACRSASMRRLEPLASIDVQVGRDHVLPVVNDLTASGGSEIRRRLGPAGVVVSVELPMRQLLTYGERLWTLTHGAGKLIGEAKLTRWAEVRRTERR